MNRGRKKQTGSKNSVSWAVVAVRREESLTRVIHEALRAKKDSTTGKSVVQCGWSTMRKVSDHPRLLRAAPVHMDLILVE